MIVPVIGNYQYVSKLRAPAVLYSGAVTLSECVNAWLAYTGKSKAQVARDAGLAPNKLTDWGKGLNPNPQLDSVEKLARGFGVTVAAFLSGPPAEAGRGATTEGSAILEALRQRIGSEFAETTWQHDVATAIGLLARALQRRDSETSDDDAEHAGR